MTARNDLDRFHVAIDVLDRLPDADDRAYMTRQGEDMPEIRARIWPQP